MTWLQGLSSEASLEAAEMAKNTDGAAGLVTVHVLLVAVGRGEGRASAASGCGSKWQQRTLAAYIKC